jgi:ribonuclease HII
LDVVIRNQVDVTCKLNCEGCASVDAFCVQGFNPERARAIVKGDSKCFCIAAASVIAKVTRDRLMEAHHLTWPQYNFAGEPWVQLPWGSFGW